MSDLTRKQADICESLIWGVEHFGGLCAGGSYRTQDLRRAEARGLARCLGYLPKCDDDGFALEPDQLVLCFVPTTYGTLMLAKYQHDGADR